MLKNKKAAMFGLDARIALAIFGALSVISGASLYTVIQETKIQQQVSLITEIAKATEAYYLDTGIMPYTTATASILGIEELVSNTQNVYGWKGPYLNYKHLPHYLVLDYVCPNTVPTSSIALLRDLDFFNPNSATYAVHIQCMSRKIAEGVYKKFMNQDASLMNTATDKIYFLVNDVTAPSYQLYYRFLKLKR